MEVMSYQIYLKTTTLMLLFTNVIKNINDIIFILFCPLNPTAARMIKYSMIISTIFISFHSLILYISIHFEDRYSAKIANFTWSWCCNCRITGCIRCTIFFLNKIFTLNTWSFFLVKTGDKIKNSDNFLKEF